jgi:hypothetical protein
LWCIFVIPFLAQISGISRPVPWEPLLAIATTWLDDMFKMALFCHNVFCHASMQKMFLMPRPISAYITLAR